MNKVITYAQNREDLYIASFFPDINDGFYIDIGAFHPVKDSVTKLFYEEGWTGVNIEPQPAYFKRFITSRKKDINLNIGVSNKAGKLKLREYDGGGFSTFSEKIKKEYSGRDDMLQVGYRDYEVDVLTLEHIFKEYVGNKHVHFLKIDVEGLEYEVIQSNDWEKYRPEMICIEANHIVKNWKPLLEKAKYKKVFFDGLNEYYLAEKSLYRSDLFSYVEKYLSWGAVVPYELHNEIKKLKQELKEQYLLQSHKDEAIEALNKKKAVLEGELALHGTLNGSVRNMLSVLKRRIGK